MSNASSRRSAGATERPDPTLALSRLKDFQRRTVDYVFDRLFVADDTSHRFLVADEVGLGKTLVARGVITKAIDALWDSVDRIDVVYICSNQDIARQNIKRLNILSDEEVARTTRLTLLPTELSGLRGRKVNLVSFTPATSLDLSSQMGRSEERVLLYWMLATAWKLGDSAAPKNVLQGNMGTERFRKRLDEFGGRQSIDRSVQRDFVAALQDRDRSLREAGKQTIRSRFKALCDVFARANSSPSLEQRKERSALIGDLRRVLAATCIRQLEPDLVILDEFQRFKDLLHGESEAALLAQELFNYQEGSQRARVLLLSATPYKMYTGSDEAGDDDHYRDFVDTLRFLLDDPGTVDQVAAQLSEMRRAMLQGAEGADRVSVLKQSIEATLRRVIVRTERLASSADRNGMLKEIPTRGLTLRQQDAAAFCSMQSVSDALSQPDAAEFWKAAPYVLNMMDEYQLKHRLSDAIEAGSRGDEALRALRDANQHGVPLLLPRDVINEQRPLDVPHPRMRWLMEDVLDRGTWKLLWLPPSQGYYKPAGPYAEPNLARFTKRLVFSAWKLVPKSIATLVSYEAERRMLASTRRSGELLQDQIERLKGLLQFSGASGRRLTGMPVVGLLYPSMVLATLGDPLHRDVAHSAAAGQPTYDEVLSIVVETLRPLVAALTADAPQQGPVDEAWYWAAPLLLDISQHREATESWLDRDDVASAWQGSETDDDDDGSGWDKHIKRFAAMLHPDARTGLGMPPSDLIQVLAELAVSGPAVCALRALARSPHAATLRTDERIRDAAGVIAHGFRLLFNLPDVLSLVRGLSPAYFGDADHAFRTKAITRLGPSRSVVSCEGDQRVSIGHGIG